MLLPYNNVFPKFANGVFVAQNATIVGDVEIGEDASIWFNTVVRGDVNYIRIGAKTNIQDLCMCHVTLDKWPLIIGEGVTIGHSVVVHGCIIKDYCLIGMGARILDGAQVGPYALIAAGSVVRERFVVPEYSLVAGVPAEVKRRLTDEEIKNLTASADRYVSYKNTYLAAGVQHPLR
jgi:carbonic anhydrase/acetyltransferase-like protein (isoleucine patch superfamily)